MPQNLIDMFCIGDAHLVVKHYQILVQVIKYVGTKNKKNVTKRIQFVVFSRLWF